MSGARAISTTSRRELSSRYFFLQGKAPEEIHAILTETLVCFLTSRAKDLSASLYFVTQQVSGKNISTNTSRPRRFALFSSVSWGQVLQFTVYGDAPASFHIVPNSNSCTHFCHSAVYTLRCPQHFDVATNN